MKNSLHTGLLFIGLALTTSCGNGSHTVVSERSNGYELRVDYYGSAEFTPSGNAIRSISPGGSVEFTRNGSRIKAEPDQFGNILYTFNDDERTRSPSGPQREFLALAVKEMVRLGHNKRN